MHTHSVVSDTIKEVTENNLTLYADWMTEVNRMNFKHGCHAVTNVSGHIHGNCIPVKCNLSEI